MRGGGICQIGLACVNDVADGRKSFSRQTFPWPPAEVASHGVGSPETDVSHGVKRACFSQTFGASAQKALFLMAGFCENLAKVPARTTSSRTRYQITLSK